jgi:hypothetical protein
MSTVILLKEVLVVKSERGWDGLQSQRQSNLSFLGTLGYVKGRRN